MIKNQRDSVNFESSIFQNYKKKLNNVAFKIKKWHDDIHTGSQDEFTNDSDFIELVSSPSRFSDDSNLEEEE